ncbi:hypothetical protein CspeluHIS016_0103330 [Cutaneotrichosporon spelunceum]|uniref:CREG-like beta-barrel domain-containing protein n=1 Tax=Cutaneotrichosporon spelunceum TaxID=1672016 RepID=A0AAD3TNC3_9TREE|nr:hypothetical protein CspeluHIS016_0103330 [Cutaneotrichosporon spelunceum]
MHVSALVLVAAVVAAKPFQMSMQPSHRETEAEATTNAARLATHVTVGTMASVFPEGSPSAGHPFALMESHAPCHPDGALTFISMPISLMQRNVKATGGRASYALATPRRPWSHNEYAIPRVSFIGNLTVLEDVEEEEHERLRECFVSYHPDAKWWIPGDADGAHTSRWARMDVDSIYYVGGFGNVGWIGHIPVENFASALEKEKKHKGKH